MMTNKVWQRFTRACAAAAMALGIGLPAGAADVGLDLPIMSQYVWRGLQVNEEPVLQPSLTVDFGSGVGFNLWGNLDLTGYGEEAGYANRAGEFTELDLTLSYDRSFGPLSVGAGVISYVFPGIGATTHELYVSAGASIPANPSLTVYTDVDEVKGSYFLLALAENLPLAAGPLGGVDVGVSAGYGSATHNRAYYGIDNAKPIDAAARLALPFALGPIGLTPSAAYVHILDEEIGDALDETGYLVVGLTASASF